MGMRWDAVGSRVYIRDCPRPRQLVLLLHNAPKWEGYRVKGKVYDYPKAYFAFDLVHASSFGSAGSLPFVESAK